MDTIRGILQLEKKVTTGAYMEIRIGDILDIQEEAPNAPDLQKPAEKST